VRDLADIFRRQFIAGFPAFAGSHAAAVIPVSAAFLNELANEAMPPNVPVSDIQIEPQPGNALRIRLRIARAALIPPLTITLLIDRQPHFPDSPVLGLRLASSGLTVLARLAAQFFAVLPQGIRLEHDLLLVDIAALLKQRGADHLLQFVQGLEITTTPGAVLVSLKASVGKSPTE
jgi:hypothetical protein